MYSSRHHSSPVSGNVVINGILCFVVVLVLAAVLMPVFVSTRHHGRQIPCQSDLKQIGVAFKTYVSDWDETYPTNRPLLSNAKLGPVSSHVQLSRVATDPITGKPIRFEHGIAWVESLYQYIDPVTTQDKDTGPWKCGADIVVENTPTSSSAGVSYVFNRNLIEKSEKVIRHASTLMLVREADRLLNSELRPINDSVTKDRPPVSAFLTNEDQVLGKTNPKLHFTGSQILFADGHVKMFQGNSFPRNCSWSRKYKTWTNPEGTVSVAP